MSDEKLKVGVKALVNKSGGTASKNSKIVRVTVPSEIAKDLKISKEDPYLSITYEDKTIKVKKISEEEYNSIRGKK